MKVTGTMIDYYFICKRELWYYTHEIAMEQNSELVAMGKILDETSYTREKKGFLIDNQINIDFIDNNTVLHEVKKTRSVEEAGEWQLKYYMYYLEKRGIQDIEAKIDYPLLKKTKEVFLTQEDKETLDKVEKEIEEIANKKKAPERITSTICKKCSYYDLCYI